MSRIMSADLISVAAILNKQVGNCVWKLTINIKVALLQHILKQDEFIKKIMILAFFPFWVFFLVFPNYL